MIPRLYTDASLEIDAEIMLNGNQTHYLKDVLRRRLGDTVRLFNGRDGEFEGEISALAKKFGAATLTGQRRSVK